MYHSPYSGGLLHRYNKLLKDVFLKYGDRYSISNILFIKEGQYRLEDNSKDIFIKMSLCWAFVGSHEGELSMKTMLCSLLN